MSRKPSKPASQQRDRLLIAQLGLLAAAVFLSPLVAAGLSTSRVPEIVMRVLVLLSAIAWVLRSRVHGSIEMPAKALFGLAAALISLGGLSLVKTVSVHSTLLDLIALICYVTVFLMVGSLKSNRSALYGVMGALLLSSIVVGTLGVKESLLTTIPDWRVFSTFFNPDFLAGFMALVLPIALAWYLSDTSPGLVFAPGLAVVLSLANLLLSGSRFGALAAGGGLFVFLVLALVTKSIGRTQIPKAGAILIACMLTVILAGGTLSNRVASVKAESHSGGFRIHTWKGTMRIVQEHPVTGTGLGTFEVAYPKYAEVGWTRLAHNSYLQLAAEGGVAMPVVLLILVGAAVIPAAVGIRRRQDAVAPSDWMPSRSLMTCGLLGGAAASIARNLVDSDWYVAAIGASFSLVLGAVVGLSDRETWKVSMPAWRVWTKVASLGAIVLCLLSVLMAQMYYAGGWALLRSGDQESVIRAFSMAIRHDPLDADLQRKFGGVLRLISEESGDQRLLTEAELRLKRSADLEPTAPKTWYQLGKLYSSAPASQEKAVSAYRAALDRDPHALQVLLALAETYERMDQPDDALGVYRRMSAIEGSVFERVRAIPELVEPRYVIAREALGRDAERREDLSEAVKQYVLALDRIKRYQKSIEEMGPVMEQMGTRDADLEDRIESLRTQMESRLRSLGR